jgi:hypothetical protein
MKFRKFAFALAAMLLLAGSAPHSSIELRGDDLGAANEAVLRGNLESAVGNQNVRLVVTMTDRVVEEAPAAGTLLASAADSGATPPAVQTR